MSKLTTIDEAKQAKFDCERSISGALLKLEKELPGCVSDVSITIIKNRTMASERVDSVFEVSVSIDL